MDCKSNRSAKRCFKCTEPLLHNLNISYAKDSVIILWNKYQIFVYQSFNFNEVIRTIIPDFQITFLTVSNNYLACFDTTGKIHIEALKLKNVAPKRFKTDYIPKESYLNITNYDTDRILSLNYDSEKLLLSVHHFDDEFKILQQMTLLHETDHWPLQTKDNIILKSFILSECNLEENIKNIFNIQGPYSLVFISFDRRSIYFTIFSLNEKYKQIPLKKLYSSPSEVIDIEIINFEELNILIGLKCGTIIRLGLTDNTKTVEIFHLNTAIYKFVAFNNTVLYTDGLTMWKSDNTYSDKIKMTKIFISQVKDFIKINNQIVCTTFNNMIYLFELDDECFIDLNNEEYCSATKILDNPKYLQCIMDEIEKSNNLVKKIKKEENAVMSLSLSNRQDIMDKVMDTIVILYEHYEDVLKENSSITLTERINEYFKKDTLLIFIKININNKEQIYNQILSNIFGDLTFHVTFTSNDKIIKTSTLKVTEKLKNANYLIPLKTKFNKIKVFIKLVKKLSGVHDEKQNVWIVLYEKLVLLNSEHFIKTEQTNGNICLRKSEKSLSDLIKEIATDQYGNIFEFKEIAESLSFKNELKFYVKLPTNYQDIFRNDIFCKNNMSLRKTEFILKQYRSEEFLNSKSKVMFIIGEDKVTTEIINDRYSSPILEIFSENIIIAFDIRNFLANGIYEFEKYNGGQESVQRTFYMEVENMRESLKNYIKTSGVDEMKEELVIRFDHIEKYIFGNLPL